MTTLTALTLIGALLLVGLVLVRVERQRAVRQMAAYQLWFPRNLDAVAVASVMAGLSGLLLPWWRRWLDAPFVSIEAHADSTGIRHYALVPEDWSQTLANVLRSSVPGVRFSRVELPEARADQAVEYRLSSQQRPLHIDPAGLSGRLLANLEPLAKGEAVVVQWVITAHPPVPPVTNRQHGSAPTAGPAIDSEAVAAKRKKQALPLLLATARIGVVGRTGWARLRLLRQVEASWHESRAPGVHLQRRWLPSRFVVGSIRLRRTPFAAWPGTYSSEELAALVGWPIGAVAVPGLVLGSSRKVPASPLAARHGTVLADSDYPGESRPLALDVRARLHHVHLLGPTGTGKSTLIVHMVLDDLENGHGVVLLDPKGDLVQNVLERIPEQRRADVVVLDAADTERAVGLNPLRAAHGNGAEVVVENLVGLFKSLYRHSWGPRLDDILRAALLTLAGVDGSTLCEVPLILTEPGYRRRIVGRLDDPIGLESFWGWYEGLSDPERLTAIGPVLNKVRAFTMRPTVRSIIGQSAPAVSISQVFSENKILLCSLAPGLLGDEAASLLGALIVAEVWHATTARAAISPDHRAPVMAYLDEWQHFVHLPTPMPAMLAEARGLGLGMTLAHQHLDQLDKEARDAVLANARSRVVFQLPAGDARIIERELGGVLSAEDLQGLGAYEVVCQLFAAGTTLPPATGVTRPLAPATTDPGAIRHQSRERYGVARDEVEQAIRLRQSSGGGGGVGRRRHSGGSQ